MAGASVRLPDHNVYLAVTRVIYVPSGVLHWPTISLVRGQIYDAAWNHLDNYTVDWSGDKVMFPTVFEVPAVWEGGGIYFGPDDPRIVVEEGVRGAEPVIVLNVAFNPPDWTRAM